MSGDSCSAWWIVGDEDEGAGGAIGGGEAEGGGDAGGGGGAEGTGGASAGGGDAKGGGAVADAENVASNACCPSLVTVVRVRTGTGPWRFGMMR